MAVECILVATDAGRLGMIFAVHGSIFFGGVGSRCVSGGGGSGLRRCVGVLDGVGPLAELFLYHWRAGGYLRWYLGVSADESAAIGVRDTGRGVLLSTDWHRLGRGRLQITGYFGNRVRIGMGKWVAGCRGFVGALGGVRRCWGLPPTSRRLFGGWWGYPIKWVWGHAAADVVVGDIISCRPHCGGVE